MNNDNLLIELNAFACGLNTEQAKQEEIELKLWEYILNGGNKK